MTGSDHDGWPDTYSDPRDRPHPDVLRITVESFDEAVEDTIAAIDAAADGEERPAVVSFATVGELRKILTDRRIEILQTLMSTDGAAESISALAETLERDYRTVHDDVTLLAEYGVVFIVEDDDRSKRPYLPYERIHLDMELTAIDTGEEPATT
jgi:predicted transcriptional regulator